MKDAGVRPGDWLSSSLVKPGGLMSKSKASGSGFVRFLNL